MNNFLLACREIAEIRAQRRIAREIRAADALTGISAGLNAVRVLIDIDPNRARAGKSVSEVVRKESRCERLSQPPPSECPARDEPSKCWKR